MADDDEYLGHGLTNEGSRVGRIIKALDRAIPPEELIPLRPLQNKRPVLYGGYVYDLSTPIGRVTSYNNTRKDEAEIIAWIDRAKLLA